MKVLDLLCRCYNCDFKLGQMENEHLTALEITIEGRDRL